MPEQSRDDLVTQDPHLMVRCAAAPDTMWIQHHNGVFVSHDAGRHWSAVQGIQPSDFGFAVAVHPQDPLTAWFAPATKDERRVPVDARLVVTRTRDGGKTFQASSWTTAARNSQWPPPRAACGCRPTAATRGRRSPATCRRCMPCASACETG
jgi:hypothetical protein